MPSQFEDGGRTLGRDLEPNRKIGLRIRIMSKVRAGERIDSAIVTAYQRLRPLVGVWLLLSGCVALAENLPDPQAVAEVRAGKRAFANAAWWGFDKSDATESLQAALNSGAKTLLIPYLGQSWIVRPLQLPSNQEILLEPGVVLLAKRGEYQGTGDSLLTALNRSNLVVRGYGACLRMHKRDYQNAPYKKAEWRMGLALRGCRHVLVEGLRVESSGGDGFYVDGGGELDWSEDITLRNCTAYDNHRQGLSVISVVNLLVENCVFSSTWGTAPEAGIDLEPDTEKQRLVNCVIRNSIFENNNGHQILVYLKPLTTNSEPVSIHFENCLARMTDSSVGRSESSPKAGLKGVAGFAVGAVRDNGPKGLIDFVHCVAENTAKEGVRIYDKSALSARVRLINCAIRDPWQVTEESKETERAPILIQSRHAENTTKPGGIDFEDCYIYEDVNRPAVLFEAPGTDISLWDVHGQIVVGGLPTPSLHLGTKIKEVDLKITGADESSRR
jgi:hypothetical protein